MNSPVDAQSIIDRYCEAWSDADPQKRAMLLADVWAEGASYTDPTVHVVGAAALLDHIAGVLVRRPGAKVMRTGEVDRHHDVAHFAWSVFAPGGDVVRSGIDIAFFDQAGKIVRIVGFFDSSPQSR